MRQTRVRLSALALAGCVLVGYVTTSYAHRVSNSTRAAASLSDTVAVFGPKQFTTPNGSSTYNVEHFTLTLDPGVRYSLRVENGTVAGANRPSTALVLLNGAQILASADLSGNSVVLRVVQPAASNTLEVTVAGSAGAFLKVTLLTQPDPTFTVFGPKTYVRGTGHSDTDVEDFTLPAGARPPYRMLIVNGPDGTVRVASATITINGVSVLATSELSANVGSIAKFVNLTATTHVELLLHGQPTGTLSLRFTATDSLAPRITLITPATNLVTRDTTVTVTGTIQDETAISVTVNGVTATITNNTFSAAVPLSSDGIKTLTIVVTDAAGNQTTTSRTITRDRQAPALTITTPAEGAVAQARNLAVTGTVQDATTVTVKANGVDLAVGTGGAITGNVTLSDGANVITVTATDVAGNATSVVRQVTRDSVPPSLTLSAPTESAVTRTDTLRVTGQATDGTALTVTANGAVLTVATGGAFTGLVSLGVGANTVTVIARDAAGNVAQLARTVTRDTTPPTLAVTSPVEGLATRNDSVTVQGSATDATALSLTVNGAAVTPGTAGAFSTRVALALGTNAVSIDARDAAGNIAHVQRSVVRDTTPPSLTLNTPAQDAFVLGDSIGYSGSATDATTITLTLNGTAVPVATGGAFAGAIAAVSGTNSLAFVATDAAGNRTTLTHTVTRDTVPPTLAVTSPTDGLATRNDSVTVQGSATDATALSLTVNGAAVTLGTAGAFSTRVSLTIGSNTFAIDARDAAGNVSHVQRSVVRDTVPPVLAVTAPANNSATSADSVTVTGTVSDGLAVTVTAAGTPLSVASNGAFSGRVALAPGSNAIVVVATDAAGNASQASRSVLRDNTPPTLTLNQPAENAVVSGDSIAYSGSATDATTVTLTLNGAAVPIATGGAFSGAIAAASGANSLVFVATDAAGNRTTLSRTVTRDTVPPTLAVTSPANGLATRNDSVTVQGSVTDAGSLSLTVNGAAVTPGTGGAFSARVVLVIGSNTLSIEARDGAGNVSRVQRSVVRDITPPTLAITGPQDGSITNADSVSVAGTVSDGLAVTVTAAGVPLSVASNGVFSGRVVLASGQNTITIVATDAAGNASQTSRSVLRDNAPPTLTLNQPAVNAFVTGDSIGYSGSATDATTVTLTLNGAPVPLGSGGAFSGAIAAVSGVNSLAFVATDAGGNQTTLTRTVTRDGTPPVLALILPADGSYTNTDSVTVSGRATDGNGASVTANGIPLSVGADGSFSGRIAVTQGVSSITVIATDAAGNRVTTVRSVTRDNTPPVLAVNAPSNGVTVTTDSVTVSGTALDASPVTVTVNGAAATVGSGGSFSSTVALSAGANTISIVATDAATNSTTATRSVTRNTVVLPPDPRTVAPAVTLTAMTSVADATSFIYTGSNPIQTGVAPGTIQTRRATLLRGRVIGRDGTALSGASVTIALHPELGATLSRVDGRYDLVVNAGGVLTLDFQKGGYLPSQRQLGTSWRDYDVLADVALVPADTVVTAVDLTQGASTARGSLVSDASGTRKGTLMFHAGTQATIIKADGTSQPVSALHLRITEYTVGSGGPAAMPAALPPTSGYTYAFELSADEATAIGAKRIDFNQAVPFYVENFLGFPVGAAVPLGSYDRDKQVWVASDNARVIKVLSTSGGVASLDVTGSGNASDATALASLGINNAELQQIATVYSANQTLWRALLPHFSAWDMNLFVQGPGTAKQPGQNSPTNPPPPENLCTQPASSTIECETQVIRETISLSGTPFDLTYSSGRTPGYKADYTIEIPLSGPSVPDSLKRIELEVRIAGRTQTFTFPAAANQRYTYTWDGLDAFGRRLQGSQPISTRLSYVYNGYYAEPAARFASPGTTARVLGPSRTEAYLTQEWKGRVAHWDARASGLGGTTVNVVHAYDPESQTLLLGTGEQRQVRGIGSVATVAGGGSSTANGVQALAASIGPIFIATGPDGSLYISDNTLRVRRVGPDGIINTVAGSGTNGFGGDGGPAAQALMGAPYGVALAPDGTVYFADIGNNRIRSVDTNGIIHTVAGNGNTDNTGDGGPATAANLNAPVGVAVGPDGAVYITTLNRVRRIGPDGIITTIAGTGNAGFSGDNGPAVNAQLNTPQGLVVAKDGSVYIADWQNRRVRRVSANGTITTVAGTGNVFFSGEGGKAKAAAFVPFGIDITSDGTLLIADPFNARILAVSPDSILTTLAGCGTCDGQPARDGGAALQTLLINPQDVKAAPGGGIYVVANGRVRRISPALPGFAVTDITVASEDGEAVYVFNRNGRHLRTLDALTNTAEWTFAYDAAGHLSSIKDQFANTTTIRRNVAGDLTAVVGPYADSTSILVNSNGFLTSAIDAAGGAVRFTYNGDGLAQTFTDANNNQSQITYDSIGRLTRDADAAGGYKTLVRSGYGDDYTVRIETSLGRKRDIHIEGGANGNLRRTVAWEDGSQSVETDSVDAVNRNMMTDGMQTTSVNVADPRFGFQSPISGSEVIRTPSGLTKSVARGTRVSLGVATDPFSLTAVTDSVIVNGRSFTSSYDKVQSRFVDVSAEGRRVVTKLDDTGDVHAVQTGGVDSVVYTYDGRGRVSLISQAGRSWNLGYNDKGLLQSLTDPNAVSNSFSYDAAGRLQRQTFPDSSEIHYAYDANGNVTSITPSGRPAHLIRYNAVNLPTTYVPPDVNAGSDSTVFSYNHDRQLSRVLRPDLVAIDFAYDGAGRPSSLTIPRGQYTFSYSPASGSLTGVSAPGGNALSYSYDGALLTGLTSTGQVPGSVTLGYDSDFRVNAVKVNGSHAVSISYDRDGLLTSAGLLGVSRSAVNGFVSGTLLGNTSTQLSYDASGRLAGFTASFGGATLFESMYSLDNVDRIAQLSESVDGQTASFAYYYDPVGRLAQVKKDNTPVASYTYDANGNRVTVTTSNGTLNGTYDVQDRLIQYGIAAFSYTANGELQAKIVGMDTTRYVYDPLGNLISVRLPNGSDITYVIDGQNRRIGKRVGTVLTQGFIYGDKARPEAEVDGAGNLVSRFVYALSENVPEYMEKNGITFRFVYDHLGSVRLVVNSATGAIAQRLDYDASGQVIRDTNPGFQPFGFGGGLYEPSTGFVRLGARDYDAYTGRWTSKDPLGFAGGRNLYAYADNNPVNFTDPSGLCLWDLCIVEGLGAVELGAVIISSAIAASPSARQALTDLASALASAVSDAVQRATGNSGKNSPGQTAGGRATDEHGNVLGPSGRPAVHNVNKPSRKRADDAARDNGKSAPESHPTPARGEPHMHPTDRAGKKLPCKPHFNYPRKGFPRRGFVG